MVYIAIIQPQPLLMIRDSLRGRSKDDSEASLEEIVTGKYALNVAHKITTLPIENLT